MEDAVMGIIFIVAVIFLVILFYYIKYRIKAWIAAHFYYRVYRDIERLHRKACLRDRRDVDEDVE